MALDTISPPVPTGTGAQRRGGGRWGLAFKIAVSAGLLVWLFAFMDRGALESRLAGADWGWLAAGALVKSLTVPFAALRWRSVAALTGVRFSRLDALRLSMVSVFLGQALPGAVGADIVRGWLTVRMGFPVAATMLALVADRLAALAGVALLVLAGLPHLLERAPGPAGMVAAVGAGMVGLGCVALFFIDRAPLPGFLRRPAVNAVRDMVADMRRSLGTVGAGGALLWSVLVHLCTIAAAALFVRALGIPASLLDCFVATPFSIIAAALPVSLAGWGARESSMAAGFALLGLAPEDAVAVALLIGVSALLMALPGAAVWLWWRPGAAAAGR